VTALAVFAAITVLFVLGVWFTTPTDRDDPHHDKWNTRNPK